MPSAHGDSLPNGIAQSRAPQLRTRAAILRCTQRHCIVGAVLSQQKGMSKVWAVGCEGSRGGPARAHGRCQGWGQGCRREKRSRGVIQGVFREPWGTELRYRVSVIWNLWRRTPSPSAHRRDSETHSAKPPRVASQGPRGSALLWSADAHQQRAHQRMLWPQRAALAPCDLRSGRFFGLPPG